MPLDTLLIITTADMAFGGLSWAESDVVQQHVDGWQPFVLLLVV
jgi:hypothetical protein